MIVPDYVRSLPVVALYTACIYLLLIAAFRALGRRQLGQLNVVDLVIILVMGSAVETAMVDGNTSLPAGFVSAGTLLLSNGLLNLLASRSRRIHRLVAGSPVLVVSGGHLVEEHLHRNGLTEDDVMEALRERGICDLAEVKFAVMEEDGEINVIARDAAILKGPVAQDSGDPRRANAH